MKMKKLMLIAFAAMLAIPFVGCKKEETLGDKIEAVKQEADKAADKAKDAVDAAKKEVDKAADKAADAVKDATK